MGNRHHGKKVNAAIRQLKADSERISRRGLMDLFAGKAEIFPLDLLAIAAIKRNMSTSRAIGALVRSRNMISARALLRVHLDTLLRFSAAWLVNDPHEFAMQVLRGQKIGEMKDRTGKKMRDAYLVEILSADYPWLKTVYDSLSGYVHFSEEHIFAPVVGVSEASDALHMQFLLSDEDSKFPAASWLEILECCHEATMGLERFLGGYASTKRLSSEELATLRALKDLRNE